MPAKLSEIRCDRQAESYAGTEIRIIGANFQQLDLHLREQLLLWLKQYPMSNGFLLSTCHRIEFIFEASDSAAPWPVWVPELPEISEHLYRFHNQSAMSHLLAVGCGADSMLIGEADIFGQLKKAFYEQRSSCSSAFCFLFEQLFRVSKTLRHQHELGKHSLCFPVVAINQLPKKWHRDPTTRVLVLGAGKMGQDCVLALKKMMQASTIIVSDYDAKLGQQVADSMQITYCPWVDRYMQRAHILFAATASPFPVVNVADYIDAAVAENDAERWLIDLGMPRNIDPACCQVPGTQLITLDDIADITKIHRSHREEARQACLLDADLLASDLWQVWKHYYQKDLIAAFRQHLNQQIDTLVRDGEMQFTKYGCHEATIRCFTNRVANRLLHRLTLQAQQWAQSGDTERLTELLDWFPPPNHMK